MTRPSASQPQKLDSVSQRLLTPDEVAVLLGIERLQVIRLARVGKIPSIKLGKVWRFRPTTIDAWLVEQEGKA